MTTIKETEELEKSFRKKSDQNKLILIDGHAIAFRAYHALARRNFRTKAGIPTWAAYGFCKILFEVIEMFKPYYLIMTFDTKEPTFRKKMYDLYKANRDAAPDDFIVQMPFITEIVKAFEIPIFQKGGYEADDLIGTLARQGNENGLEVSIVTGDRDLLQLVNESTYVYLPNRDEGGLQKFGVEETTEKYGVRPDQFVDYKGLIGDKSDNIPGIHGMGPKGATKLLDQYESLENIYQHLDEIKNERTRNMLADSKEIAFLSRDLARIEINAPVELDLETCHLNVPDQQNVLEVLKKLEFGSLINSMPKILANFYPTEKSERLNTVDDDLWFDFTEEEHSARELKLNLKVLNNLEELRNLANELEKTKYFAIDLETTGVNSLNTELVGLSVAFSKNSDEKSVEKFHTYYLAFSHKLEEDISKNLPLEESLSILKDVLENENIGKIGQNIKFEINVLSLYGIKLKGIQDDTFLADYVLNPSNAHGLKEIAKQHLNYLMTPITDLIGTGRKSITIDYAPLEKVAEYCGADSAVTLELSFYLRNKLEESDMLELYNNIELPLIKVLAGMEQNGIKIDESHLHKLSEQLSNDMQKHEAKIFELAGKEFNVNSPKQLSQILFEELQIPSKGIKKNKTTGFSTDASVLEKLASEYEIVSHIQEYRQLAKLKSTYADSLTAICNPKTGKVHTSFNQAITTTGRLSSTDPNLQNIPIKTEIGREIRRAFIPSAPDSVILTADYSQIELRLLAHYTDDPIFIEAFSKDLDIHSRTVMDIFDLKSLDEVTPELRRIGKTVNFGIVYGQTAFGLSEKLNVPVKRASEIINKFNETYQSVANYARKMIAFAEENAYVETLFKRRRYLPEISSPNRMMKEFARRTAINTPLQGTAADLIKIAMIRIDHQMNDKFKSKMLLQVHDELVFEVTKDELEEMKFMIRNIMENVYPDLKVPLKVSVNIGDSWVEAK